MRRTFEKYDVGCEGLHEWNIKGQLYSVADSHDMTNRVAGAAVAALWRMQAKRRLHLRGLERGRDEESMEALMHELRSPKHAAMMNIVIADSVHTPARAHMRWGFAGGCTLCGDAQGDWRHYVEDCPHTPRAEGLIAYVIWAIYQPAGCIHQAAGRWTQSRHRRQRIPLPAATKSPQTAAAPVPEAPGAHAGGSSEEKRMQGTHQDR